MSLQSQVDALFPDNSTGDIVAKNSRDAHAVVISEVERSVKTDGTPQMDANYTPKAPQDLVTLQYLTDSARGQLGTVTLSGLNAVGTWVEIDVPFDGAATRWFNCRATIFFDTTQNANGEIQYEFVLKNDLNQVQQTIEGSDPIYDMQVSSAKRRYQYNEDIQTSDIGGKLTFRFRLMGNWGTPTNTQCKAAVYDEGTD